MITNLIQVELAHVNTNHPDFIGGSRAVSTVMEKMAREQEEAAAATEIETRGDGRSKLRSVYFYCNRSFI